MSDDIETESKSGGSDFQTQLMNYSNKIQDVLENIRANIQESRFNVERLDNGIKFDIALKATIKQNPEKSAAATTSSTSTTTMDE